MSWACWWSVCSAEEESLQLAIEECWDRWPVTQQRRQRVQCRRSNHSKAEGTIMCHPCHRNNQISTWHVQPHVDSVGQYSWRLVGTCIDGCDAVDSWTPGCTVYTWIHCWIGSQCRASRIVDENAVELPLTDDQTRCSIENPLELPHVDAIHSSEDSITIVYATDDHSVDQGNCSVSRQCSSDWT